MSEQFIKIFGNATLNSVIDRLLYKQFVGDIDVAYPPVSKQEIHKSVWLGSILAQSDNQLHRQKAQDLASLLALNYEDDEQVQKASYIIYSRAGNLTASKFLNKIGQVRDDSFLFNSSFGSHLDLELGAERARMSIGSNHPILLTDFQHSLWRSLNEKSNISITAPTSSGKSFIIQRYINAQFREFESLRILYVVSSRALLSQVSEEFRSILPSDVQVNTSFVFNEDNPIDKVLKHLFVLTPERCLRLLQAQTKTPFEINIIFVDEIQNVEEPEGRGVLLEHVLNEISVAWPNAKKVIAGPLIKNPKQVYNDLFSEDCEIVETIKSPVFHIKTIVSPNDEQSVQVNILSHDQSAIRSSVTIKTGFDLHKELNVVGNGLARVVKFFTLYGQSIIYAPKTDLVQSWAKELSDEVDITRKDSKIEELIEFLSDEIHPKYFLISCLNKGIAFHHAKLPDIVRKEIEDLFSERAIKYLFCTSTLLEGVNLPANNLFIISPKKRTEPLTAFEFGNLIGRAGRIKDSLYGTIFCIEKNNESWAEKYYGTHYDKTVTSSTKRALKNPTHIMREIDNHSNEIKEPQTRNTIIFLRHKYLKGASTLRAYLERKEVDKDFIPGMEEEIERSMQNIVTPYEVLQLNPSIDPLLQDKLYQRILKDGLDEWIFHYNENFYSRIPRTKKNQFEYRTTSLFWQLESILTRLDGIFDIQREAYIRYNIKSVSIGQMCSYASQWLENMSYRELILEDIKFHARHSNEKKRIDPDSDVAVNKRINEVIKIHSTVTTFLLVKYIKLLNDLLSFFISDPTDEKFRFTFNMPVMLELGTTKGSAIQLISMGVNRSVALKVVNVFERVNNYKEIDIVEWLKEQERLPLKPIYNRYLNKMHLLKPVNGS